MNEEIKYFSKEEIEEIKESCKDCERHTTSDLVEDESKGDANANIH